MRLFFLIDKVTAGIDENRIVADSIITYSLESRLFEEKHYFNDSYFEIKKYFEKYIFVQSEIENRFKPIRNFILYSNLADLSYYLAKSF